MAQRSRESKEAGRAEEMPPVGENVRANNETVAAVLRGAQAARQRRAGVRRRGVSTRDTGLSSGAPVLPPAISGQ
jgi:hypothetical protein